MSRPRFVVLDPGHGGTDPGVVFGSQSEKAANLACALTLKKLLEDKGIRVELTRAGDNYPPFPQRTKDRGESLFVALHFNSAHTYPCVYYQMRGGASRGFAELAASMLGVTESKIWSTTVSRFGRLYIDDVRATAVLLELEAIDKYADTADWRLRRLTPIAKIISAYLER